MVSMIDDHIIEGKAQSRILIFLRSCCHFRDMAPYSGVPRDHSVAIDLHGLDHASFDRIPTLQSLCIEIFGNLDIYARPKREIQRILTGADVSRGWGSLCGILSSCN